MFLWCKVEQIWQFVDFASQLRCHRQKVGFQFLVHEEKLVFILNNISAISWWYHGGQFYQWRKREYPEKTTELPHISDKCYQIMLYPMHLVMSGSRTHNFTGHRQWFLVVRLNSSVVFMMRFTATECLCHKYTRICYVSPHSFLVHDVSQNTT